MRTNSRIVGGLCAAWLVLGGATGAIAGPAEAEAEAPAAEAEQPAPAAEPASPATAAVSVPTVQRDMETDMAAIGELASDAKRDSDLVRAACVLDKQERAQGVMELATGELMIIRDTSAGADARGFAVEKLQAASERLGDLVSQARECVGDKTPEISDDETRNQVDEEPTIPVADPTVGGGAGGGKPPPVPPPVDDGQPPTVGSPSL